MKTIEGTIESFDERRGDGYLKCANGERFYFHCVSIANGERRIPTGVRATGQRVVGRLGRDEVQDIRYTPDL